MAGRADLVTISIGEGIGLRMRRDEAERLGLLNQRMQESENPEPEAEKAEKAEPKRRRKVADKTRRPEADKAEG